MKLHLLLFLLPALALADKNCPDRPFELKGKAVQQVKDFDEFILKPRKTADFAARLAKEGLPFSLDVKKGGVKGVSDWISANDEMSGDPSAYLFLKKFQVGEKSGLEFDHAYLLSKASDTKAKYKWNVPFNTFYPLAVDGDELLFRQGLHPLCRDGDSQEVVLAVKPDGSLRVREWSGKGEEYQAAKGCSPKKFFSKSDYAMCSELTDLKTKKKVVLVWEGPMS